MRLLRGHDWPGNLREFSMVVENAVLFALAENTEMSVVRPSRVIQIRPKLVHDLLVASSPPEPAAGEGRGLWVHLQARASLNKVSQDCERQIFEKLYLDERGDFGAMAGVLLGDREASRKVQLRFNQLGLKVRELKARLR